MLNSIYKNKIIFVNEFKKGKNYRILNTQHTRTRYSDNYVIGTFGRVRLVKHKQSGKYYAAKILKKI